MPSGIGLLGGFIAQHFCAVDRDLADVSALHLKHNPAPGRRNRVVKMDDCRARPLQRLKACFDQITA